MMSFKRVFQTFLALGLCVYSRCQEQGIYNMKIDTDLHFEPAVEAEKISADSQSGPVGTVSEIALDLTSILATTKEKFLSICIDTNRVAEGLPGFDFSSARLQNMAAALSPIDIRIGGTKANFLLFDPMANETVQDESGTDPEPDFSEFDAEYFGYEIGKKIKNFTLSGKRWDELTSFFLTVGWDLMFDFNIFLFRYGLWDTTNAEILLDYSAARGIPIPYFQLGNEPNSYKYNFNITILPETLVKDLRILRNLLYKYPLYKDSAVYSPDVTALDRHYSSRTYLQGFITAGGAGVVDEIALHHYYIDGRIAKVQDFLDHRLMDTLHLQFGYAQNITSKASRRVPIRLTETSSAFGGGATGLSDGYVAGFLWLDKLGISAKYGITQVFRQTFYGGRYALVTNTLDPNPDYYLSLLYKRLIEGPVFNVQPIRPNLRVYGHCAKRDRYPAGALVIYFLNLDTRATILSMGQFREEYLDLYLLTPGDSQGLLSKFVKLNGEKLVIQGSLLPQMLPKPQKGDVRVEGQSFGFIVVPNAKIEACKKYYEQKDLEDKKSKADD